LDVSDLPETSPLRQVLENRRSDLWEGPAVYLEDVVARWRFEASRTYVRIADQVAPKLEASAMGVLLARAQERQLIEALNGFVPTGPVSIEVPRYSRVSPTITVRLRTDEESRYVTLRRETPSSWFEAADPASLIPVLGIVWAIGQSTRGADDV